MRRGGFTLIELSIALAIVAVMFAGAVMSIGALTGTKAKASAAELGGTIRSLYDTASLSGKTCRLVFEMPEPRDDESPTKYWAECASGSITARKDRDDELKDAAHDAEDEKRGKKKDDDRFRSFSGSGEPTLQDLLAVEKERVDGAAKFAQFTSPEIEPHELPSSVKISVWTRHQREMAKSGTAYLYFFPQGYTEKAYIWVRQGSNAWTLTVAPLTGKTAVVPDELEVPRS
ncbi:MAG: pilus assembly FimT family protein [Myxococcaceae bacterium]